MMPDEQYLAYIAGIFDGEGFATLSQGPYAFRNPVVGIGQTGQLPFLEELQTRWGGSILKYKRAHMWKLSSASQIQKFLSDILPWIRFKRDKAVIVLAYCEYVPKAGGRCTEQEKAARLILERKFVESDDQYDEKKVV